MSNSDIQEKPAFVEWNERLSTGEVLPRGKYFKKENELRDFMRRVKAWKPHEAWIYR